MSVNNSFARTGLLLGEAAMDKLAAARVAVFGVGGVGGYVCEALARCGVGAIDIVDDDFVNETNINRQIIATRETVGRPKTEVMRERLLSINPGLKVTVHNCFFLPATADSFDFTQYSYVVDAIDTVTAKLELAVRCRHAGTPLIASMGTGNKLDPTAFRVADISKTKVDRLARVMRKELGKRGIKHLKVVYSEEEPAIPPSETAVVHDSTDEVCEAAPGEVPAAGSHDAARRSIPGSIAFVPSVAGLIIAGEVVKDLTGVNGDGSN